ncbi:MAG: RecA protein [Hydrogenibacillus schlegelii]|uniref:Protein RecA n=1 Tax=Hydrogenibacillus schlegelii TaxID=1484 RepID=A0A2T5GD88_HYDSH|nr:MAG: RecA protein [Hydrogenibacillus schlegelii]
MSSSSRLSPKPAGADPEPAPSGPRRTERRYFFHPAKADPAGRRRRSPRRRVRPAALVIGFGRQYNADKRRRPVRPSAGRRRGRLPGGRRSEGEMDVSDRKAALERAIKDIERQHGKGAIMRLGERAEIKLEVVPSGSLALDIALGVGGFPRGRIIEIFGPESSGKTTVALHAIAEVQKMGGTAAFIDAEHALDPVYAERLGVNIDDLYVSQPDTGEQALDIAEALVRSGAVDIVVIDSVAALVPKAEIDGDMGDSHVGLQARLMSQALRKLAGVVSKSRTIAIFINQLREKVGVMFGNPETTPGGRALKFYASIRLDVRRAETIKQGTEMIGARTRIKVVKNKVAPPFRTADVDIIFGEGISREGDILDLAVALDLVTKSGAWYTYGDTRIGQGRENAKQYLKEHPELAEELEKLIRERHQIGGGVRLSAASDEIDAGAVDEFV